MYNGNVVSSYLPVSEEEVTVSVGVAVVVLVAESVDGPPEERPAGDAGLGSVVRVTAGSLSTDVTQQNIPEVGLASSSSLPGDKVVGVEVLNGRETVAQPLLLSGLTQLRGESDCLQDRSLLSRLLSDWLTG